ncbi:hypothetical protein GIB67_035208 [Kingdonia uniflora]|uniref:Heat shock protein 90 n=1 Tax=Kingdonia uniflora TaxID=39325 RepID=A0A7J7KXS7_9MAGN|nr:hypothetical protein GIB67_035208 [Kingdonia uniflora]
MEKEILGDGDDAKLEILIKLDKEKKILSIRDRGIGMTKEDLIKNLGKITKSGTSAFVEKMKTGGDLNLIGQLGVGFYSVYLVAGYIEVISRHDDDKQYVWESKVDGSFATSEDEWNQPLGCETEIRLSLGDEAGEYVNIEVPADEDESTEEETSESTSEEKDGKKKPKTKTMKEKTYEWEVLNDVKAIWLHSSNEVTNEEYAKFYRSLAKDFREEKPLSWSHFTAEGDMEFKARIFVPPKAPRDSYENY